MQQLAQKLEEQQIKYQRERQSIYEKMSQESQARQLFINDVSDSGISDDNINVPFSINRDFESENMEAE